MKKIETIRLDELLKHLWRVDVNSYPDAAQSVDAIFQREGLLRRLLPLPIVRRLDTGFARSNTVHPDSARALYSICRASRARAVFETGTYWGYSTAYLAAALQDEGAGKVWSFDIYPQAGKHIPQVLRSYVELHRGKPSIEMMPDVLARVAPDLLFQDSRHDYEGVAEELELVVPYLRSSAVVLLHDFVQPDVRRAALDVLEEHQFYVLNSEDPQQLGLAIA